MPIYYYEKSRYIVFNATGCVPYEVSSVLTKHNVTDIVENDGRVYSRNKELLEKEISKTQQKESRTNYNRHIKHYLNTHKISFREHHSEDSDYYYADKDNFVLRIRISNHRKCNDNVTYLEFKYNKPKDNKRVAKEVNVRLDAAIKNKPSDRIKHTILGWK